MSSKVNPIATKTVTTPAIEVEVLGFDAKGDIQEVVTGLFIRGTDIPETKFDELIKDELHLCYSYFDENMVLNNAHHSSELEDWELNSIELVEVA